MQDFVHQPKDPKIWYPYFRKLPFFRLRDARLEDLPADPRPLTSLDGVHVLDLHRVWFILLLLMDKILHDLKDSKLWELWYIPYNG